MLQDIYYIARFAYICIAMAGKDRQERAGRPLWEKIVRWVVFGTVFLLVALIIGLQIALRPSVLTKAVNKIAAAYVDGEVSIGRVEASVVKKFPLASVTVEDLSITYPHEKFAFWDSLGIRNGLRKAGAGENGVDTLVSAGKLEAEIHVLQALKGSYHISRASLDKARIFAHMYDSLSANWNVIKIPESGNDTTASEAPRITVNSVSLKDRPLAVFTDIRDTLFGRLTFDNLDFKGKFSTEDILASKFDLSLEKLLLSGRTPTDTVSLDLDYFSYKSKKEMADVALKAGATLGLKGMKKMDIPVEMTGKLKVDRGGVINGMRIKPSRSDGPFDKLGVSVKDLDLKVATLELKGDADAIFLGDSTYVKAGAKMDKCKVGDLIAFLGDNIPTLKQFSTDAVVSLDAACDGFLNPSRKSYPDMRLSLKAPRSAISYKGIEEKGWMSLDIVAGTGEDGKIKASFDDVHLGIPGLDIDLVGTGDDLLGDGNRFKLDAKVNASLSSLSRMIPDSLGISAEGDVSGNVKGNVSIADLTGLEAIMKSGIRANLNSQGLKVKAAKQGISAYLGRTNVNISPSEKDRRLSVAASVDSLRATYGKNMFIRGRGAAMGATTDKDGTVSGHLNLSSIAMMDVDSTFIGARDMKNSFTCMMDGSAPSKIYFKTDNGSVALRTGTTRVMARNAVFSANASLTNQERASSRRKAFMDSLQRVYPGTPRDSLLRKMMRNRMGNRSLPDYLSERDFAKKDIDIHLGESMAELLRKWNVNGNVDVGSALVITPAYPLRNEITGLKGKFDNNSISLSKLDVKSGNSDMSATGSLTGLRRALQSKGMLNLDLALTSDKIDVNEALAAWVAGEEHSKEETIKASDEHYSDTEFTRRVVVDSLPATDTIPNRLIVLPSNLKANVSLQANSVNYSSLDISWMAADLKLKERCLQATNALATSNMGDLYFEGFYSTKTKKDLKGGFDLTLVNITADRVIELLPVIDSIIPMLKTFKGTLDCQLTATSALDTNMNLVMSTINGVMNIGGKNLSMSDNKVFNDLAKTLMFKNKEDWKVDRMEVNGVIGDNILEVFPFVLRIDRYTFALAGIQNFDQSFDYHASVLRSPIPFRFGLDIRGNFDKWKWKVVKAKFKNTNVPVFTTQLDTMRVNLTESIHNIFEKGVEKAIEEVKKDQEIVERHKEEINYSVQEQPEELDESERREMESLQAEAGTEAEAEAESL